MTAKHLAHFAGSARRLITSIGLSAVLAVATVQPAFSEETVDLVIDFAKILQLNGPISTLIIGNPGIADATIQDDRTIVLTGRAAGMTNLIAMDDDGKEIANVLVRVASNVRQLTTVFYGSKRQTLSCAPTCEQVISVGDDDEKFQTAKTQIESRQAFSESD
ncbi:MAG: pilus assembly protein N-terminal domain-containing protein [Hyphomicrobiales bacterium]|nr:pilus assembly protein N-terminal domain-containing protein [Hyphomicrobiales bacterium]